HGDDPAWDRAEAEALYRLLEEEVIPAFYQRDASGIPLGWVRRMRESMARLTGRFSTNRMAREYTESYYLPAASAYRARRAQDARLGADLERWVQEIVRRWPGVAIESVQRTSEDGRREVTARIKCNGLDRNWLTVELYADAPSPNGVAERLAMTPVEPPGESSENRTYRIEIPGQRAPDDYTARVRPFHPAAHLPLELNLVTWER
ncbi:MAG: DUF3417 domain-containing protein, partial [Gammaproteobacteria bacterium]